MELSIAKKALEKALKEGKPKAASEKTDFLNNLKSDIVALIKKGFSANQIHGILKEAGFLGSYQTVRAVVLRWKEDLGLVKPREKAKKEKAEKEAAVAAPGTDTAAVAAEEGKPKPKPAKEEKFAEKQASYDTKLDI